MARLIDADKYPCQTCNVSYCHQNCEKFIAWFNETVDAVEVVHGYNTDKCRIFECSECGYGVNDIYQEDERNYPVGEFNYCPNCGAKMDGDGNA